MKRALAWIWWPLFVTSGMLAVRTAIRHGAGPTTALIGLQIILVGIISILERWMPEHPEWNRPHHDLRTDCTHMVVSGLIVPGALRWLIFTATPSLALWPTGLPVVAQLFLAMFLSDFGSWATHVATHKLPLFWPIHAPHHSSLRLYWLNASRMHPLDTGSTVIFSLVPLAILGTPTEVLALFDSFAIVHLMLQHSNVRLRHGLLNHIFATAEFHRWHHSNQRDGGESNYASFFSLWDHIFRTFRMPHADQTAGAVGLYDGSTMPDGWLDQVRHPFRVWSASASGQLGGKIAQ
jgi:sterol desaturase/sphingolipid hydroxylase (fatty acid hydroxylase superfamily)